MEQHSVKNSWGTPDYILDEVRRDIGQIYTDPASNEAAQQRVRARVWYGPGSPHGEDGLVEPWEGAVWLNPPYGKGLVMPFVNKLCWHQNSFAALVNLDPSTVWFNILAERSTYIIMLHDRVAFINPETGEPVKGNPRPQAILTDVEPRYMRQLGITCRLQ